MLSSVLHSARAIQMNIEIMRVFARYRSLMLEHLQLKEEVVRLDSKLNHAILQLLKRIDALTPTYSDRRTIGFQVREKQPLNPKCNRLSIA